MLDILSVKLVKWLIIFAALSTITHVYGLTTGDTELVSPIAYTQTECTQPPSEPIYPVILPSDQDSVIVAIMLDGTYVPEESPDGGYPVGWLDNSPTYSDGWTLLVNDSTTPPVISWRAPEGH
jgi:hypothetical protein